MKIPSTSSGGTLSHPFFSLHTLTGPFKAFGEAWNRFWFTPGDPLVLGFLRIWGGLVLTYLLVFTTVFLEPFYAHDGALNAETMNTLRLETPWVPPEADWDENPDSFVRWRPNASRSRDAVGYRMRWFRDPSVVYDQGMPQFSPYYHIADHGWLLAVHLGAIATAILFTLGLWTRVTGFLAWFALMSYSHRASAALFGMDTMMAILLMYLVVAPAGASLSLDRLIERYRLARGAFGSRGTWGLLQPELSVSANVAIRLLQIHFCLIYLASGTSKLQGVAWWNGTALWMTLSNYEFAPARFEFFTDLLRAMTGSRAVWELIHTGGSIFTISLEMSLPFLIWYPRWRWLMLCGPVLLHAGIAFTMGLVAFSILMILLAGSFLPPQVLRAFLNWLLGSGPLGLCVVYDSRQGIGVRFAAWMAALDVRGRLQFVDAAHPQPSDPEWVTVPTPLTAARLVSEDEQVWTGYAMFERIVRSLRVTAWPLALMTRIPGVGAIGRALWPRNEERKEAAEPVGAAR